MPSSLVHLQRLTLDFKERANSELTRRRATRYGQVVDKDPLVPLASNDLLFRAPVGRADHASPVQSARPQHLIETSPCPRRARYWPLRRDAERATRCQVSKRRRQNV